MRGPSERIAGRLPSSLRWSDPGWKYRIQRALVRLVFWSRTETMSPIHRIRLQMCWSGIRRLDPTVSILFKALSSPTGSYNTVKAGYIHFHCGWHYARGSVLESLSLSLFEHLQIRSCVCVLCRILAAKSARDVRVLWGSALLCQVHLAKNTWCFVYGS